MKTRTSTQHVYRGCGEHFVRIAICDEDPPDPGDPCAVAATVPARCIMSREVVCARDDLEVRALVQLMIQRGIGSIPIVDREGVPVGMVTKQDLVEQLLGREMTEPVCELVASDVMMPLAFTLDETASIARAAALMSLEGVHHIPIVAEGGCLLGVVSTFDIVRWVAAMSGGIDPADCA